MKTKRSYASFTSTIMGYVVALAQAWITIDWKDFDLEKEWPKLVLSAAIAVGGHITSINMLKKKT